MKEKQNIIIYTKEDGTISLEVKLKNETLWLSLNEIATLFQRDKSVISKHLSNLFKEGELDRNSAVANFATTASDGKTYQVEYYNLDAIISVGYKVNSKQGTIFRRWASQVLRDHLIKGFSVNSNTINQSKIEELQKTVQLLVSNLAKQELQDNLINNTVNIINNYTKTWNTLLCYDENKFITNKKNEIEQTVILEYPEAIQAIQILKNNIAKEGHNIKFFGVENSSSLQSILKNLSQTFDGVKLYNSNIEKAAHLLYFIIKNHPFIDGNKRIACLLFLLYIEKANIKIKISNNEIITMAILIAESDTSQKNTIIQLIITLIEQI